MRPILLMTSSRRRRVPGPRSLQLLVRPLPAGAAEGKDPGQRLAFRHAQPEHGHHGHFLVAGLAGALEVVQVDNDSWWCGYMEGK